MFWVLGTDLPEKRGRVSARQAEYFANVLKNKNPHRLFILCIHPYGGILRKPDLTGYLISLKVANIYFFPGMSMFFPIHLLTETIVLCLGPRGVMQIPQCPVRSFTTCTLQ
jgi:hypothetical protein